MRVRKWIANKKNWDFIRDNIDIMSTEEMADYFNVTTNELYREKAEMGFAVEEEGTTREYELKRFLNRWERTWTTVGNPCDVPDLMHKIRKYDTGKILMRKFT